MKKFRSRFLSSTLIAALVLAMALPAGAALIKRSIEVDSGIHLYVDGKALKPTDAKGNTVEVFASNGTTYLPIRAIAGALRQSVAYSSAGSTVYVGSDTSDSTDAEYLKAYFNIAPFSGTVSRADFDAALKNLGGEKSAGVGTGISVAEAVKTAMGLAGMNELALTYTAQVNPQKAARHLADCGVAGVAGEYAPYVAAALDCSLAFAGWDFNAPLDASAAATLLMNALELSGRGRSYLGMASDSDIYAKLQSAWKSFGNFDNERLSKLGASLVVAGASTGYNLKFDGYNANFLPGYTLQYGHSDITHAVQLIALLNSEGIDAKVALEPKTSIYEYMVEWGDPKGLAMTDTYEVKPIDGGRYLCYATEYDMKLEFHTLAEKNDFDRIVNSYAKKWLNKVDEKGVPTQSLLYGAWFQPLYTSAVPMTDAANFTLIKDNVIRDGAYTIHPFSTAEGTAAIAKVVKEKAPDLKVQPTDLFVNNAFYRYLTHTGED
jgi:hypothetical protein